MQGENGECGVLGRFDLIYSVVLGGWILHVGIGMGMGLGCTWITHVGTGIGIGTGVFFFFLPSFCLLFECGLVVWLYPIVL